MPCAIIIIIIIIIIKAWALKTVPAQLSFRLFLGLPTFLSPY
jgi:hypothetical protein